MSEMHPNGDHELDPVLARAAAVLRRADGFGPEFEDRVMTAVRQGPAPRAAERRRRVLGINRWATASDALDLPGLRPLAIAAGLAAVLTTGVWLGRLSVTAPGMLPAPTSIAAHGSAVREVEFVLAAPGASEVVLVGDFNGWKPGATPLQATQRDGIWSVTVPLVPGRHEYAFLIDGKQWLPDPRAPRAPGADFGTPNSVLTVTEST